MVQRKNYEFDEMDVKIFDFKANSKILAFYKFRHSEPGTVAVSSNGAVTPHL